MPDSHRIYLLGIADQEGIKLGDAVEGHFKDAFRCTDPFFRLPARKFRSSHPGNKR